MVDSTGNVRTGQANDIEGDVFYHGFDYLRAIMAIAVVAWHSMLLGPSIFGGPVAQSHSVVISAVFYLYFCLLGVPVFFLVSFFLSSVKLKDTGTFLGRIKWLAYLYVFWLGLWTLQLGGVSALSLNVKWIAYYIVSGGGSPLWYLFSLVVLTIVCFVAMRLPRAIVWLGLAGSLLILLAMPAWYHTHHSYGVLVAPWNPFNFLPYVFIGVLIAYYVTHHDEPCTNRLKALVFLVFVLFVGLAVWEMSSVSNKDADLFPFYTRLSLVAEATFLCLACFFIRRRPPRYVRFLSDYSLGIYCTHFFVLVAYDAITRSRGSLPYIPNSVVRFTAAVVVSILVTFFLRRAFRLRLI
jgi:surface polysaccharide O-acyltransferase-like enzyme